MQGLGFRVLGFRATTTTTTTMTTVSTTGDAAATPIALLFHQNPPLETLIYGLAGLIGIVAAGRLSEAPQEGSSAHEGLDLLRVRGSELF